MYMSKIFYDKLLTLEQIDLKIKKIAKTKEEKEEMWALIDEIIHHKALGCVLDKLPRENHDEFLSLFHNSPHDEELLFGYLRSKIGENIEDIMRQELGDLAYEILKDFK